MDTLERERNDNEEVKKREKKGEGFTWTPERSINEWISVRCVVSRYESIQEN